MTFIKVRIKGQSDWQYVGQNDVLAVTIFGAVAFDAEDVLEFLARAPNDFPNWECKVEKWTTEEWIERMF